MFARLFATYLFATYSMEQLEFLVRFYEAAVDLTKQEIAKLAAREP